ncbi:MAG: hypothetical protein DMD91_26735 [Candidatus Rokuibacteriota bacterium]|nr:MAG: hypothetical protein DMD91_26735 [Candidatus Rokubacteria bacterium]
MQLTRRDLLRWGIVLGGGAALSSGQRVSGDSGSSSSPPTTPFVNELKVGQGIPPVATPVNAFATIPDPTDCLNPDGTKVPHPVQFHGPNPLPGNTEFFKIHEKPVSHSFNPQAPQGERTFTNVLWGYARTLQTPTGLIVEDASIPGPTIVAKSGTPQLVRFFNDLVADSLGIGDPISAVHRHGGFQNPEDDGYPLDTFCFGDARDYYYPNRPAGGLRQNEHSTNWYHDHSIDVTGPNVYRGLAGFYPYTNSFDTGDEATGLQLPGNKVTVTQNGKKVTLDIGPFDIGLVLQDRLFDRNGRLVYNTFDHDGFIGDKFCVNGLIQPFLRVATRRYRFRILNGSNARVYQLFLSNGQSFQAIATDSTLLEHPVTVPNFRLAPAERVEVIIDFTHASPGDKIYLVNRLQQTDGRKPDGLVSPGTKILEFRVDGSLPTAGNSRLLSDTDPLLPLDPTQRPEVLAKQAKVHRSFEFERSDGAWVINGEFFDENRVNARPAVAQPEIWTLSSGGGWVHPVHIHLSDFSILSRDGMTPPPLERGRKDTVLIGADVGDATILIKFDDPRDATIQAKTLHTALRYVFHCHNIEHEDMRMMGQFEVLT